MQRMHERRSATADGFDAGPKGTARRGRQTDGSPPPPLTPGNPEDRGREMLLSSLSCVYLASRMSPPAPPALLVRALTILWRPWEKGVLPVPVPIDFEPETTAQQWSPSSYASTSKASDGQAASLARSEGGREHPTRRDCLPSRLLFWLSGGVARCWLGLWRWLLGFCILCLRAFFFLARLDRGRRSKSRWNSAVLSNSSTCTGECEYARM
ncbi:hypothetical protein GTR04_5262 [Trichophyton interdigitale]|nr:hypothetical protein GY631_5059 [Trichophyton interdigitale]KAG5218976.1 hypothetical protein GY632_5020 [Trichophyton interdigitale]KAG8207358.1 hypothetical protein GTR04_5262 [Trichophyton interdigitale]